MHLRVTTKRKMSAGRTMLFIEGTAVDTDSYFSETLFFRTTAQLVRLLADAGLPISIALQDEYGPMVVDGDALRALGVRQLP